MVSFKTTKDEFELIAKIAKRAEPMFAEAGVEQTIQDTMMDLSACVANGCPLRLADLLAADDFNFVHDVFGIRRHIDRSTGLLQDCFLPRFYNRG